MNIEVRCSPAPEKRAFVISPTFFDYDKAIEAALRQHGYTVRLFNTPASGTVRLLLLETASRLGFRRFWDRLTERTNADVMRLAEEFNADIVLFMHGGWVTPQTFASCAGGTKAIWFYDAARRATPNHEGLARVADKVFVFERSDIDYFREKGIPEEKVCFLAMGYDPAVYRPARRTKSIDVAFVGKMYANRTELLHRLVKEMPHVRFQVFGRYLRVREVRTWFLWARRLFNGERRSFVNRDIAPDKVNDLYNRSKIVLNIHHPQTREGCNPRTIEIIGAGAFQICDRNAFVAREISGDIVQYDGLDDLKEKITAFLHDDKARDEIAARTHEAASAHTFAQRVGRLLEVMSGGPVLHTSRHGVPQAPPPAGSELSQPAHGAG